MMSRAGESIAPLVHTERLAAEYAAVCKPVVDEGRRVIGQLLADSLAAVYQGVAPSARKVLSEGRLRSGLNALRKKGVIGEVLDEGALVASRERRRYEVDYRWGNRVLTFTISFDAEGQITALAANPRQPLDPDPHRHYQPKALCRLPFEGVWFCFWGGRTERQNYHIRSLTQRYAYDFVIWKDGGTCAGEGACNEDYFCWGRPIVAPAAGIVVAARDGVQDSTPHATVGFREALWRATRPGGNEVILDLGYGEFCHLAHFRRGSIRVATGQRVHPGTVLGLCGNSGNSSEPHLHVHLQSTKSSLIGDELPLTFQHYCADGARVKQGEPVQGQFLIAIPSADGAAAAATE